VFKTGRDECHDREEDCPYFPDDICRRHRHPDGEHNDPVAEDAAEECLSEGESHLTGSYLERPTADRIVSQPGVIDKHSDKDAADKVRNVDPTPIPKNLRQRRTARKVSQRHHAVSRKELGAADNNHHESHAEDGSRNKACHSASEVLRHVVRHDGHKPSGKCYIRSGEYSHKDHLPHREISLYF